MNFFYSFAHFTKTKSDLKLSNKHVWIHIKVCKILTCVDEVLVNGAVGGSEVRVGMEVTTDWWAGNSELDPDRDTPSTALGNGQATSLLLGYEPAKKPKNSNYSKLFKQSSTSSITITKSNVFFWFSKNNMVLFISRRSGIATGGCEANQHRLWPVI